MENIKEAIQPSEANQNVLKPATATADHIHLDSQMNEVRVRFRIDMPGK